MILKIRSRKEGENWHYVSNIANLTISNRKSGGLSDFKRRVFAIHDVILVSPPLEWEEVDNRKGCSDPRSPEYSGPIDLTPEEFNAGCTDFGPPPVGVAQAEWVKAKLGEGEGDKYDQSLNYYEVQCTDTKGKEFMVVFDGDLYLLNDYGNTVDHFDTTSR